VGGREAVRRLGPLELACLRGQHITASDWLAALGSLDDLITISTLLRFDITLQHQLFCTLTCFIITICI
jgi:hypothetical protein